LEILSSVSCRFLQHRLKERYPFIGVFEAFTPKFVKNYAEVAKIWTEGLTSYANDLRAKMFPEPKHIYLMIPDELVKLKEWAAQQRR